MGAPTKQVKGEQTYEWKEGINRYLGICALIISFQTRKQDSISGEEVRTFQLYCMYFSGKIVIQCLSSIESVCLK